MQRLLNGQTIDEVAIERLRQFADVANAKHDNGYMLAFSGGKDSVVILDLARRSGVKFEAVYNLTTVDPPEVVKFVKATEGVRISRPEMTMWQLVRKKGMPPLRHARYCCEVMKERNGEGRFVITGVRWEESSRRSNRKMVESCYRNPRSETQYLNPIIDWTTGDVWQYIRDRGLPYCSLYDEGWKRVGCVLCPMCADPQREIRRWPKLAAAWKRAIVSTWRPDDPRLQKKFPSGEAYWQWWLQRNTKSCTRQDEVLFEDDPSECGRLVKGS